VAAGSVYVISQDNQIFALNAEDGRAQWNGTGASSWPACSARPRPAFAQSTVVAGFSSGELTAYRYENGQVVWQDALARTGVSTIVGNLSDIDADPVVDNGRVFAVGQGGRMVAVELNTGQRAWELNIAVSPPVGRRRMGFRRTDRAQLLAISRASGKVRWMKQLQRYRSPEKESSGPVFWRGPVLAGGRLVLASSVGHLIFLNPADGAATRLVRQQVGTSLPPVVANEVLYILDDTGMLSAYR
jgi:outer membrane protein assembly factor BamB